MGQNSSDEDTDNEHDAWNYTYHYETSPQKFHVGTPDHATPPVLGARRSGKKNKAERQ